MQILDDTVDRSTSMHYYNAEDKVQLRSSRSLESLCSTCKCVADHEHQARARWSSLPILDDTATLCDSMYAVHYENFTTFKRRSDSASVHVGESQISICSSCRKLETMTTHEQDIDVGSCSVLQESLPVSSSHSDSDTTLQMDEISCTGIDRMLTPRGKIRDRPSQLTLNMTDDCHDCEEMRSSGDSGMASTTSEGPKFVFDTTALVNGGYLPLVGETTQTA